LIVAAREYVQNITGRSLITQTHTAFLVRFERIVELLPNLQSVAEIRYIDLDGAQQVLANTEYVVDKTGLIGTVFPAYDKAWPATRLQISAIEIDFICGYGDAAAVPQAIKQAMLLLVDHWYKNRGATASGSEAVDIPFGVDSLLAQYKVGFV
jgi:uncharacterized phiE125 gp8 family phage protein